jgi:hypothetical protein
MKGQRYCKYCQDYYPSDIFPEHMRVHEIGNPSIEHKQYTGFTKKDSGDYMICILHQKKVPCPIKGCGCSPFGMVKKSIMVNNAKKGVFHTSDAYGRQMLVPIDMDTKTVVLLGVPIHLKI